MDDLAIARSRRRRSWRQRLLKHQMGRGGAWVNPELVMNGTFNTDVSRWTGFGATPSWSAGKMIVTSDGAGNVYAYQVINGLTPGATYRLTATCRRMDANSATARVSVYDTPVGVGFIAQAAISSGAENTGSVNFTAPADGGVNILCILLSAAGAGAKGEFDNVSLRRV